MPYVLLRSLLEGNFYTLGCCIFCHLNLTVMVIDSCFLITCFFLRFSGWIYNKQVLFLFVSVFSNQLCGEEGRYNDMEREREKEKWGGV